MVKIKVCGITSYEEAKMALDLGIEVLGFVFYPSSRRYLAPEEAREIIRRLPPFALTVGVFVNEPPRWVKEVAAFCPLEAVQLHGEEPPDHLEGVDRKVIKAFRVKDESYLKLLPLYQGAQGFLLDASVPHLPGGSGRTFNWDLALGAKNLGKPIILAGGLTPENVEEAILKVQPYGVDVSSGVETRGKKDKAKMAEFKAAVERAEKKLRGYAG